MSNYKVLADLANANAPAEFTGAEIVNTPFATYPTDLVCDRCGLAMCDHAWQVILGAKVIDCEVAS